jgi:hypothetical protein
MNILTIIIFYLYQGQYSYCGVLPCYSCPNGKHLLLFIKFCFYFKICVSNITIFPSLQDNLARLVVIAITVPLEHIVPQLVPMIAILVPVDSIRAWVLERVQLHAMTVRLALTPQLDQEVVQVVR